MIDPRLKKLEAIAGIPNTLRAFSIPIAQQVGDAEGDGEGIHHASAAEQRGKDLLAREAQHAAAEHGEADDPGGPGVQLVGAGERLRLRGRRCVAFWHCGSTVPSLARDAHPGLGYNCIRGYEP
jgi:hypothetical protein